MGAFNKWITTATLAGLFGLILLNADAAATVVKSLSGATNSYVTTVQGRAA